MLAILAPGQGAQTPGQLRAWRALPGAEDRLRWFSAAAGIDLLDVGCEAPAETIRDTAIAQPLIVASGLIAAEQLGLPVTAPVGTASLVLAGHSVGEITAAVLTGVLSAEEALVLVALRGRAMADASARAATGMTALLGGDAEAVAARLAELDLTAANRNGAGQIVAAGTAADLARLAAEPPAGVRLRPLSVAGAFHTHHMAPARDALAAVAGGIRPAAPLVTTLSNADGARIDEPAELLRRLVAQVAAPVRWDLCLATLRELGVSAVIELPPAGTLAGIARRELPGTKILPVKSPDDLPAARELIAEHLDAEVLRRPPAGPAQRRPADDETLVGAQA
ncbi:Malonyl CoA-acyl carrier protein transacylase [Frankia canadensis]|uniref:[acyl-carrier-protein] S-malonyltransferase n=1 Tax=Frankia canadensis TaxID=1836972 RepID=A0A2I2KTL7_9ACTN|nr:ACP S-malonyltransferase [Frankia canadensis]SNQ49013.1 Malonyl CoA-acyl carrier protein transacylase [Frankia canadensis]SOU56303.1 Malonyl CoA-acyl carrier protein transacylase [Frankia canadensis]